jgi:hypothetical protein
MRPDRPPLLIARGDHVCITEAEIRDVPRRPGSIARVERGAYGFEVVLLCEVAGRPGFFRGEVRDTWGLVPCA